MDCILVESLRSRKQSYCEIHLQNIFGVKINFIIPKRYRQRWVPEIASSFIYYAIMCYVLYAHRLCSVFAHSVFLLFSSDPFMYFPLTPSFKRRMLGVALEFGSSLELCNNIIHVKWGKCSVSCIKNFGLHLSSSARCARSAHMIFSLFFSFNFILV